jgi:hypothetical protein
LESQVGPGKGEVNQIAGLLGGLDVLPWPRSDPVRPQLDELAVPVVRHVVVLVQIETNIVPILVYEDVVEIARVWEQFVVDLGVAVTRLGKIPAAPTEAVQAISGVRLTEAGATEVTLACFR